MRPCSLVGLMSSLDAQCIKSITAEYKMYWQELLEDLSKWAYAQTAALEGCLTLAPGSEAAVWDNWSAKIWRNYGVHVSPKMCWAPMHPLKKSTWKSMTKWCKINENLRGWVPLEPCWLKMTPSWSDLGARWPRGSIFHWILESFWDTKIIQKSMEKWSDFQTP